MTDLSMLIWMNEKWNARHWIVPSYLERFRIFSAHAKKVYCKLVFVLVFHVCSVVFAHKLLNSNSKIDCQHWCRLSFIQIVKCIYKFTESHFDNRKNDRRLFILFCFLLPLTQSRQHSYYDDALYSLFSVTMLFHFCHVAHVLLLIGLNKGFFSRRNIIGIRTETYPVSQLSKRFIHYFEICVVQAKNTINLVLTNPKWENSRKVSQPTLQTKFT